MGRPEGGPYFFYDYSTVGVDNHGCGEAGSQFVEPDFACRHEFGFVGWNVELEATNVAEVSAVGVVYCVGYVANGEVEDIDLLMEGTS